MSELKRCPICGVGGHVEIATDFSEHYWNCRVCDSLIPKQDWDKRPIEDELQRQLDEIAEIATDSWTPDDFEHALNRITGIAKGDKDDG